MIPQPQPDVSVIVPLYNAADTIDRCLESLVRSRVQALEIICVNDGSTDSSASILDNWARRDARIRVYSQTNAGVSAARNLGLQHVTGRYIAFVDADDEVTPDYLKNLLDAAEQHQADVVVCGQQQHTADGQYKSDKLPFKLFPQLQPADMMHLPAGVCSHLYAVKALQAPGGIAQFPLGIRYGEDTAFHFAQYPQCRRAVQVEENGYIIYYTEGSSNSKAATVVFDMLQATAWLAAQYKQHPESPELTECFVRYASHTLRRIHSLGLHSKQKAAAGTLREILLKEGITQSHLQTLKKRDAATLTSILNGGCGLNLSYYIKRFKKMLRARRKSTPDNK